MAYTEPRKSLGQHWLNDLFSLESMCDAVDVDKGDMVLEIGPGQGSLTDRLIKRGAVVIAVEYDKELVADLEDKYKHYETSQVWVQYGDIRTYDLSNLLPGYKIVANIPYYLTAYLLRLLTNTPHKPSRASLLVQKEVAQRVAAIPGDMSVISVAAQFYYDVSLGQVIAPRLFTPPPKVDSQILILNLRPRPLIAGESEAKEFLSLVKAGFSQRRKTLQNALSGGLRIEKPAAESLIAEAGLPLQVRAQELSLVDWQRLYKLYRYAKKT